MLFSKQRCCGKCLQRGSLQKAKTVPRNSAKHVKQWIFIELGRHVCFLTRSIPSLPHSNNLFTPNKQRLYHHVGGKQRRNQAEEEPRDFDSMGVASKRGQRKGSPDGG